MGGLEPPASLASALPTELHRSWVIITVFCYLCDANQKITI